MDALSPHLEHSPRSRALESFRLTDVPLYRFDVIVLGGGAAGCTTALAAADAGATVAVISKCELWESNTRYAQGGVAAVMSDIDSTAAHLADTCAVGCGLSAPDVVRAVVEGGPAAVQRLIDWGAELDVDADGALELSREGGHSFPRVLHAGGDATGRELQRAMTRRVTEHDRITCFEHVFAIDLLREGDEGRACGVLAVNASGQQMGFTAGQVVLATGGAGQLYRETTNPVIATGDGVALAYRAGATLRDLEFFQFHPTCLYIAGAARVLISEIVRGAGGRLRDKNGERFMPDYHPDAELAPRDAVSRAVFDRMVRTDDTNVYLDLRDVDGDPRRLFPSIAKTCELFGIDLARDPIPVRPGLHYMIGGVRVDLDGRTDVPGLWAVGECASTGLHGANRMGSNSLLEGLVLGHRLGEAVARDAHDVRRGAIIETTSDRREGHDHGVHVNIQDVTYSLKSLMWRQMGVVRDEEKLIDALPKIELWTRAVESLAAPGRETWELRNMLDVARLSVISAFGRRESRGVHYRSDYPELDSAGAQHSLLKALGDRDRLSGVDVAREPLRDPAEVA
ncbi:MAG: L-aspartate oxidase [Planctomycetota bacterium]|jgi:L-aspartate oxidase